MKHSAWVAVRCFPNALGSLSLCLSFVITGCHKMPAAPETRVGEAATETDGVILKPEEVSRMGLVTSGAKAIMHSPEATGFAVVVPHESIASAVAELDAAAATERQSRRSLERTRRLAGTVGAMPADTMDGLERQAAVDRVASQLSQRRLSALFGQNAPWKHQADDLRLRALADGDARLVRISFPLGSLADATPRSLRLAPINGSQSGGSVETRLIWAAPADANVPGHSFFAYLKSTGFGEGEHLIAWVPVGEAESGVLVPQSAALINAGKYWCYVEEKPGQFVRAELNPTETTADGFFVKEGIQAGAKVVTVAAGQLLARELNPSATAGD